MHTRSIVGTTLSLLVAVVGLCVYPGSANAAQSSNFLLQETGPGNAAGVPHGSTNYRMEGDLSWRQETPLTGQSFIMTNTPPAQSSSSSSASSVASQDASSSVADGGHRGEGTTTTNPPTSRTSSRSSARPSSASSSSSVPSSASPSVSSSSSSEYLRPAAASESSAASGASSSIACDSILCVAPFWRPLVLVPVPSGGERGIGDVLASCMNSPLSFLLLFLVFLLGCLVTVLAWLSFARRSTTIRMLWYAIATVALLIAFLIASVQQASAAVTSPQRHVYNGHLLNASGQPITTAHSIRFSQWYDRDMEATDVVAGVINTGAATYAGYQEVHTVTPDSQGYFSVILGTGAALPDLATLSAADLDNLFLQVEVKAAAALDSSYEMLDVNPSDPLIDRSPILSVPFAQNADLLDQREIGTGSGSIPLLASGGVLPVAVMPGGTNSDTFVVDADDSAAANITLQFGTALAETLTYDIDDDTFIFSADVEVQGDLVVTGLINGIDISSIAGSDEGKLRVSSGGGLSINVTGGSYRINGDVTDYNGASGVAVAASDTSYVYIGSGGLAVSTVGFPDDESFIRLAEVVTNGTDVTQVNDRRIVQSDDREQLSDTTMNAEFPNASYQPDAVDNVGQLAVSLDDVLKRNFYLWTSTRTTLQDYDIVVRVALPSDFVRWDAAPLAVTYRTTSAAATDNRVDISVFDTNGSAVMLAGGATGLASTSWSTASLTYSGNPTWTAGQDFMIKVKLSAKDQYQAHTGSIRLRYVRLTP